MSPQPQLPLDPDVDAARDLIADARARRELEAGVRAIVDGAGLPEDEGDELVREAIDFGPALDLEDFAMRVGRLGERRPTVYAEEA